MIKLTVFQVDAFTSEPFKGNPAGVCITDLQLDKALMQNIAAEMNLSETAFVFTENDHYGIRFYSPTSEVPLCGHATLSAVSILFQENLVKASDKILFNSNAGFLEAWKEFDWFCLNFPQYPLDEATLPLNFAMAVGFNPKEIYQSSYNWYLATTDQEHLIHNVSPDFQLMLAGGFGHLMITAPSSDSNYDFIVRCFAPHLGINEDPVTGSAQCALTPYWHKKTGKREFTCKQVSKRSGIIRTRLKNNRVEIMGQAVTIFKADFII